jgi:hypothetical protein
MAIRELRKAGIDLDYVETNAFWANNEGEARKKIRALLAEGVSALCISIDPFHAEYVPYGLPLELTKLCDKEGLGFFLWKKQFLSVLSKLDRASPHSRKDLEEHVRGDYIDDTARAYGLRIGGRAINIEEEYGNTHTVEELLDKAPPCPDLLSTGHFHVDQDGYFIPPGCTGIRLPLAEAVDGIPEGKYPVFEALYEGGLAALSDLAKGQGFVPEKTYASRCNLCFHIRAYLAGNTRPAGQGFAELDGNHYEESLKYYSPVNP